MVGDVLTPVSIGSLDLGSGIQLSVSEILGNNTLVLENVQGNFSTNSYILFITKTTLGSLQNSTV